MPRLALRSPQFKYKQIPVNGVASTLCQITIDTVLRYSLIKNVRKNTTVNFDISELARDYLDIYYDATYVPQSIAITTTLTNYSGLDATGSVVGSATTFTDTGFEGYGYFEENTNPDLPTAGYLISKNPDTNEVQLYYPKTEDFVTLYTGKVPQTIAAVVQVISFGGSDTAIGGSYPSTIKRIECTKYGAGRKIIFINRHGSQQDLWFFLKETKTLSRKNEGYKANILTYPITNNPATYSISDAPNKTFNTTAKQTFTLSSGYYPQGANNFFEELLLSEYVWYERPNKATGTDEVIPVKVNKSSIQFKTSVNDRLIEYTIEFEEAFDYINNIR
tara:strand:+ start:506 stop:1504 length:999 start_codon:yes stop_codon:yes gene_type:complete